MSEGKIEINKATALKESAEMNNRGTIVKTSVPRILLEILLYGNNSNKKENAKISDQLQGQLNKMKRNKHKARCLWYIDSGEKSDKEKKEWLIKNSYCKYYVFLDCNDIFHLEKDYIKSLLSKIRILENAVQGIKSMDIKVSPDKPKK